MIARGLNPLPRPHLSQLVQDVVDLLLADRDPTNWLLGTFLTNFAICLKYNVRK